MRDFAADTPLGVGDIVRVREYPYNPDFWDDGRTMMEIAERGLSHKIAEVESPDRFKLSELTQYIWRRKDLIIVIKSNKFYKNPNYTFKMRKRKSK
jgi:hypothetical protein